MTQSEWYRRHERELDKMVSELIHYNISHLMSHLYNTSDTDEFNDVCYQVIENLPEDGGEPTYVEALQHWIVDDWFADRLEEEGEMINKDVFGMTVWGRATFGQAISMDYVVQKILKEYVESRVNVHYA